MPSDEVAEEAVSELGKPYLAIHAPLRWTARSGRTSKLVIAKLRLTPGPRTGRLGVVMLRRKLLHLRNQPLAVTFGDVVFLYVSGASRLVSGYGYAGRNTGPLAAKLTHSSRTNMSSLRDRLGKIAMAWGWV